MDIDSITIGDAKKLAAFVFNPAAPAAQTEPVDIGYRIVVLDRGFVVIGDVTDLGDKLRIVAARTIRRWGTTKGLGEIVAGPTSSTVHEALGDIEAPARAVIFTIKAERAGWARSF